MSSVTGNVELANAIAKEAARALGVIKLALGESYGGQLLVPDENRDALRMRLRSYIRCDAELTGPEIYDTNMAPHELVKLIYSRMRSARDRLVRALRAEADRIEGCEGSIDVDGIVNSIATPAPVSTVTP